MSTDVQSWKVQALTFSYLVRKFAAYLDSGVSRRGSFQFGQLGNVFGQSIVLMSR